jgi:hypothetical protein
MSSRSILRRLQRARQVSTFAPARGRVFAVPYLPGTASDARASEANLTDIGRHMADQSWSSFSGLRCDYSTPGSAHITGLVVRETCRRVRLAP